MGRLSDVRSAAIYSVLVIALSVAVVRLVPQPSDFMIMFTPTVMALVMMLVVVRDGYAGEAWARLGLHRLGLKYWPVAFFGPALVGVFAMLATILVGQGSFGVSGPLAEPGWLGLLLGGFATSMILSAGEEIGWRGYLLPRLLPLGQSRALLISGLVWATWHMPFVIWFGYHSEGNALIVVPLFYATIVTAGFFFGYMRLYSDSVWPAVIGHSIHNFAWGVLAMLTITADPIVVEEYLAGDNGVFILAGTVALLLWAKRHYGWGEDKPPVA